MHLPDDLTQAVNQTVTSHLSTQFGSRDLLLTAAEFREVSTEAAEMGARLLEPMIHQCYPLSQYDTQVVNVAFDDHDEASRVCAALAFGASTAMLFGRPGEERGEHHRLVELLSAIFNLGVGLIDGICDDDRPAGLRMLDLIESGDVATAAVHQRPRGWLRVRLPDDLQSDAAASFAVDVVETFFSMLHAAFPNDRSLRLRENVGAQLAAAMRAERSSLTASLTRTAPEALIRWSRATSVLPFQIVATLASGDDSVVESGAAALVGEAMWRIDDLVDLCDDAAAGALNAVLVDAFAAAPEHGFGDRQRLSVVESLLGSGRIADVAAQAAEDLAGGLRLVSRGRPRSREQQMFLYFTQRYAGVA